MDDLGSRLATAHGCGLLRALGIAAPGFRASADHPALSWRRAGLLAVTGRAEGPALVAPVALGAAADGALAALRMLAPDARLPACGALLLGERARLLGLGRGGRTSANRSCRIVATADGHVALNLPRPQDREALPALLGAPARDWPAIETAARGITTAALVEQGALLGMAVADVAGGAVPIPFRVARLGPGRGRDGGAVPLVVDLSALWAGPLAGAMLAAAGARVVKVESVRRPDGARSGDARFFDMLHAGKTSVTLDFADPADLSCLRELIAEADIVIEGSRPRALAALGIDAAATAAAGATWISITGHGREGAAGERVGFGDDAAVAGGLAAAMARAWGEPLFAGDAIADPLTGITAALAAIAGWRRGGGRLIALALAEVTAHACAIHAPDDVGRWQALAEADVAPLYPMRAVSGLASRRQMP